MSSRESKTESSKKPISPFMLRVLRVTDEIILRVTKHWLGLMIVGMFIFQALPWVAPYLMQAGFTTQAEWIYAAYAPTCHQLAYRSFFVYGKQPAYTAEELQAHLETEHAASDLLFWRAFTGDAQVGFKTAYCERDAAIYTTAWLLLIAYALLRRVRPVKELSVRMFLIVFVPPIALDGFTQLFGLRESSALLRVLTGTWFAIGGAWFVLPRVDEALRELYADTARQLERVKARDAGD